MWWGGRGQSFNIAPQKEEPEMGSRMPEPRKLGSLASSLASGCLPGEQILAWAPGLRKGLEPELPGILICTNFRVTFQPCGWQRSQETPLSSEYDFSLVNIERLEAVSGLSRVQLHPGSQLKFIPAEILIHGRDFRLLRIGFEAGGLEPQAFQVTMAIVQARAQSSETQQYGGIALSKAVLEQGSDFRKPPIPLLETLEDWEMELKKQGARGWRVSTVNERFDVATSLPRYFWVPSRILDSEVKSAFGHFRQGRGPRLSWHHPGGSDLVRCGGFYTASDPNKEDIRAVESMLQAGHSDVVLVDTMDELPGLADIQLAHLKLRALCLPDSSVAEDKWLSALEGTRWLDYVRACLRKASDISVLVTSRVRSVVLQASWTPPPFVPSLSLLYHPERGDRDLNGLLSSLVQLLLAPEARTLFGFQSVVQREWVAAGHPFLTRFGGTGASEEAPVFLLFLDCVWQLLQQFPAEFEFSEFFLLALHDSVRVPDTLTFLRNTPWERGKQSGQFNSYTQVYTSGNSQPQDGNSINVQLSVWDWDLRYSNEQILQFHNPGYDPEHCPESWFPRQQPNFIVPGPPSSMWLFSRGALTPLNQLCPWRDSPSLLAVSSRWLSRPATPSESLADQEWGLPSHWGACPLPPGLLLPGYLGPQIRLWKRCYLRGRPEVQMGLSALTISGLQEELTCLQELLRKWTPRVFPQDHCKKRDPNTILSQTQ
ncbi:myotubularin-related protein 11 isoform X2 [Perognathus longimembris pacificus]|uniref:myotubularin-related protein 11 isoform X2 n=1 Tax=Perognathus longimembris pacificus TaxID=214514 RepID=UPI00201867F5|nr:myotubularin-related protein 11 isoform X2 [Perognathus longimembris pacificus]